MFLPQSVNGLKGSCVRIPCRFTLARDWYPYLDTSCKAQWLKGGNRGTLVFDSSGDGDHNLYQGELVGNLLNKDCTTIFHNLPASQRSKLFFRIDCYRLKYNFDTGVEFTVKGSYFG